LWVALSCTRARSCLVSTRSTSPFVHFPAKRKQPRPGLNDRCGVSRKPWAQWPSRATSVRYGPSRNVRMVTFCLPPLCAPSSCGIESGRQKPLAALIRWAPLRKSVSSAAEKVAETEVVVAVVVAVARRVSPVEAVVAGTAAETVVVAEVAVVVVENETPTTSPSPLVSFHVCRSPGTLTLSVPGGLA